MGAQFVTTVGYGAAENDFFEKRVFSMDGDELLRIARGPGFAENKRDLWQRFGSRCGFLSATDRRHAAGIQGGDEKHGYGGDEW
jgi:hypothetical protein